MARVTNTPARLRRKRRILKAAKGFWGKRSKLHRPSSAAAIVASADNDRKIRACR